MAAAFHDLETGHRAMVACRRADDLPVDPVAWQPVASEKRQRQDQLRARKIEHIETQTKKAAANKKRNRLLASGGAILVILVLISRPWSWGSEDSADTTVVAAPTTIAGAPTTISGTPTTLAGSPSTSQLPAAIAKKPEFTVGTGDPPKELVIKDLVVGTGPEAKAGSSLTVHYVGKAWSTGEEFDSTWSRDGTFDLTNLGQASVIEGWNKGLIGIKQGGRRQLTIPADLAYGAAGQGSIKGGETLVFVIDALKVT
jgi:peptidylprolyl isomerase